MNKPEIPPQTTIPSSSYEQGKQACRDGKTEFDCPYPFDVNSAYMGNDRARSSWLLGFIRTQNGLEDAS